MVVELKGFRNRWNSNHSSDVQLPYDQDDPGRDVDEEWSHVKPAESSEFCDKSESLVDVSGIFGNDDMDNSDFSTALQSRDFHGDAPQPVPDSEGVHSTAFAKDRHYVQPRPKSSASKSFQPSWISSDVRWLPNVYTSR